MKATFGKINMSLIALSLKLILALEKHLLLSKQGAVQEAHEAKWEVHLAKERPFEKIMYFFCVLVCISSCQKMDGV